MDYITSQTPDKGVQISNDSIAMTSSTIPGFAGNLIEAGIVLNGAKSAVYKSTSYPANADGKQRPGAVVGYSSEFSVGEGFSVASLKSELPEGYLRAVFLESAGGQSVILDSGSIRTHAEMEVDVQFMTLSGIQGMGFHQFTGGWWCAKNSKFGTEQTFAPSSISPLVKSRIKFIAERNVGTQIFRNGELIANNTSLRPTVKFRYCWLFCVDDTHYNFARIYKATVFNGTDDEISAICALDAQGKPCFVDAKKELTEYNRGTGQLIAGFTLSQAYRLGAHLPASAGSLTISLPIGYEQDDSITASLETARSKGWTLTIQTYIPETNTESANTFALKRIWVRRTQDEQGAYIDVDGTRWQVDWCVDMITPDGSTPDTHSYERFRSIEAATEYWGLTPWVDPEQEEEFTQEL